MKPVEATKPWKSNQDTPKQEPEVTPQSLPAPSGSAATPSIATKGRETASGEKTDQTSHGMTLEERWALLQQCELILVRGRTNKAAFMDQGQALLKIRAGRLYKDKGYVTFDTYCHDEWGFSRQRASLLIIAFQKEEKATDEDRSDNERKARAKRKKKNGPTGKPTPPDQPPEPKSQKEELFTKIEKWAMELVMFLRKLSDQADKESGYRKLDPILGWVKSLKEEEAI